eukprot:scaffold647473_cov19-Prasinocladus_malaysianus.AAC.1
MLGLSNIPGWPIKAVTDFVVLFMTSGCTFVFVDHEIGKEVQTFEIKHASIEVATTHSAA